MALHNTNGKLGEEIAIRHLESISYKILERNWHYRHKEIDLIAQDKDELVIVEVKYRTGLIGGEPYTAVNKRKQKNLIEAAHEYVMKKEIDLETRFDIISIIDQYGEYDIEHFVDAFQPSF